MIMSGASIWFLVLIIVVTPGMKSHGLSTPQPGYGTAPKLVNNPPTVKNSSKYFSKNTHQHHDESTTSQNNNYALGDIMIICNTSLMLRAPHARIAEDIDIIARFYPTKEKLDKLCQSMSQDPKTPFTFEIDVYPDGEY